MRNLCRAAPAVTEKAGADEEWHFFIAGISIDASFFTSAGWAGAAGSLQQGLILTWN